MTRHIIALSADAYAEIRDLIPSAIKNEDIDQANRTADIELSEAVILKSYDNGIHIDLGAKRVFLEAEDFEYIKIR